MSKPALAPALLALAIAAASGLAPPAAEADRYRTTQSDFGGVGLLQTPTARFSEEGGFSFNANRVSPYSRYSVSVTPLPWVEGTLRYSAMTNRLYSQNRSFSGDQSMKDKAFDAKFRLLEESYWLPQVAAGFIDMAGTGLFSSEYLVASKRFWNFDVTVGLGWGYLGNYEDISNPFAGLREEQRAGRRSGDRGGNFSFDTWFSGPAAFIGGIEYQTPWDRLKLKVEYDGNDYLNEPGDRTFEPSDSRVNFGAVYKLADGIDLSFGWERGNTAMFGITFYTNLKNRSETPKLLDPPPEPRRGQVAQNPAESPAPVDWADISNRLQGNAGFEVETIAVRKNEVIITGQQRTYRHEVQGLTRAARVLDNSLGEGTYEWYTLVNKPRGLEVSETSIRAEALRNYEDNRIDDQALRRSIVNAVPSVVEADTQYEAELKRLKVGVGLAYKQNMGGPDAFILYQFLANFFGEYRFTRNSWIRGNVGVDLINNWDEFKLRGQSDLPQVRTHIREYLVTSEAVLENLQYTWTKQLNRDLYVMAYGGLLENMFGGAGAEMLYRPFDENWAIGVDLNWAKQRGFRQDFDFLDYSVWTGHVTGYLQTSFWDLHLTGSVGRYLAGDVGATVDVSRRFANGVTVGAWITRTDVSAAEFGEGSFDKGLYINVPFDAFFARSTTTTGTIRWNPMTRDGGARLGRAYHLYGMTGARDIDWFNDGFHKVRE